MSVPAGSIRCMQYPFVTRRVERVHRCPKNSTHCYRRSGVQFIREATPARTHGQAAVWVALITSVGLLLDSDLHSPGSRAMRSLWDAVNSVGSLLHADALPNYLRLPGLILAGGGLLALARRGRRQLVA